MKITKINTGLIKKPTTKVVGMATVELDGILVLRNIKIIDGNKGFFLGMPSMKGKDEKGEDSYNDVFFLTSEKARNYLTSKVIENYMEKLEKYEGQNSFENDDLTTIDGDMPF